VYRGTERPLLCTAVSVGFLCISVLKQTLNHGTTEPCCHCTVTEKMEKPLAENDLEIQSARPKDSKRKT